MYKRQGLEHRLFRAFPLFGGIFKVAVQPGAALLQLVDLGLQGEQILAVLDVYKRQWER